MHESQWRSANVTDYDVDFQRDCLGATCDASSTRPVTIQVRNADIARVVDFQGIDVQPRAGVSWPSVDSMYTWIRQILHRSEFSIEVVFDTVLHVPVYVGTEDPGKTLMQHYFWNFVPRTTGAGGAAPVVSNSSSSYWMGAPLSKSKRVTWRSR